VDELPPIDGLTLTRDLRMLDRDDRALRRSAARGELVRVTRGAYATAAEWGAADPTRRYQLTIVGAATVSPTWPIVSHASAAALWGIPMIGHVPAKVHVLSSISAGSRSEGAFTRHATGQLEYEVESGEIRRTSLRRTLVEYCATESFSRGVVALDWALAQPSRHAKPRFDRPGLIACADALGMLRGRTRFDRALAFADASSGSPGESFSRAQIHELGFPAPVLQKEFRDRRGFIGRVDFWWPEQNLIGEFDGVAKYLRDEFTGGASADAVVLTEKARENRLRATGPMVTRWDWTTVANPRRFYDHLRDAGLRSRRRPRR
jgi:hypothetical protein